MALCHLGHFYVADFSMRSLSFELCMLGFWNFTYGFLIKKKKRLTRVFFFFFFFFFHRDYFLGYGPLKKYGWNLVSKISKKILKLEPWTLRNRLVAWVNDLINFLINSDKILLKVWSFAILGIFAWHTLMHSLTFELCMLGFEISYMDSSWKIADTVFFFLSRLCAFPELWPSQNVSTVSKHFWS